MAVCTQLRKLRSLECWNWIQITVHFTSRRSTTWWSHQKVVRLWDVGIDLGVGFFILVAAVCMQANKTLLVPTPRLRTGLFNKIMPPEDANKEILRKCSTALVGLHPAARVHGTVQGVVWHARVHGMVQGVDWHARVHGTVQGVVWCARVRGTVLGVVWCARVCGTVLGVVWCAREHGTEVGVVCCARVHGTVQGVIWHARVHGTALGVVWHARVHGTVLGMVRIHRTVVWLMRVHRTVLGVVWCARVHGTAICSGACGMIRFVGIGWS